ncbi:lipopolysaccharide biosynthesis protein [Polaribacter sp.]|uniref:lipopolysaccharide biosynthesis protein n=1 Tax=Polaribacter sp. TaxID=1920175 RepID=UPI003EF94D2E
MLKKLVSHTAIYGLAPQIPKIFSLLALPIITKDLTDVDYGVFGVVTAYTAAVSVLSTLGLRLILVNGFYYYPGQYKWVWRQIYGFLNIWNLLFSFLLGFFVYLIIPIEAIENRITLVLLIVTPFIFFKATSLVGMTYYQLQQKPLQIALRTSVFGILTVIMNLFFISYLKIGFMGWFWTNCIVGLLTNFSYLYPINIKYKISPIYNFKYRLIKKSLKVSIPIIPHHYSAYLVESSDRMVMDVVETSTGDIGKYNIAYSIGNLYSSLGVAAGYAVGPMMNKMYKEKNDRGARDLIFILQIGFFYITFVSCMWMKEIFNILINNDVLNKMYYLAIIIAMSYNYRPMYLGAVNKLFYKEKTNFLWKLTFTVGLINLGLNFIFIPVFGFEAAAFTTFLSLMLMGYAGYYLKVFKEENEVNYYQLYWLLTTVLLTVIVYFIVEFNTSLKFLLSIIFTLITLVILYFFIKTKKIHDFN